MNKVLRAVQAAALAAAMGATTVWAGLPAVADEVEQGTISGRLLPAAVEAPEVTGAPEVGSTLRVSDGTWQPDEVTITYQWFVQRGQKWLPLKNATGPALVLTNAVKGTRVRVRMLVSAPGHTTYVFTSRWTRKVVR